MSSLKPPAKLSVIALGDYMDWRTGAGVHGRPTLDTLSKRLACLRAASTIGNHLSEAVRLGLLVVTTDPSPNQPCIYRAAVPTGEAAATAGTLPLDLPSAGHSRMHRSPKMPSDAFEHPSKLPIEHPPEMPTNQEHPDQEDQTPPPSPPGRPLLAVVPGGGNPGSAGRSRPTQPVEVIPRQVELISHALVAALPEDLPGRVARRWERHVAVEVARLLTAGWDTEQLVERTVRPSWRGVVNAGAVLVQRLRDITDVPPAAVVEAAARCGRCDVHRQVERPDGRMARCPDCHPLAVARF